MMRKRNDSRFFIVYILAGLLLVCTAPISLAYEKEINGFSDSIAEKIADEGKKTAAVMDFTDLQGNMTELGRFFSEELSVALADAGKELEILDRNSLKFIIAGNESFSKGTIDPRIIREIGQNAGVEALITGTITPFSDNIRISIRILDTQTAKMFGSLRGNIARTKAVAELLAGDNVSGRPLAQPLSVQAKRHGDIPLQPEPSNQLLPPPGDAPETKSIRDRLISILSRESSRADKEPFTDGLQSKEVGALTVTVKKITFVPDGGVDVLLGLYNASSLKVIGLSHKTRPSLQDEKNNVFEYRGGIQTMYHDGRGWRDCLTLDYQKEKDVVLHFGAGNKEVGTAFALSLNYLLYNPKNRRIADYQASFVNLEP